MESHKKFTGRKKRLVSGMLAGLMAVSNFLGTGSALTAHAEEEQTETSAAHLSIEGVSPDGEVSVVFTAEDSSWSHTYTVREGKQYLDNQEVSEPTAVIPNGGTVDVLVSGDDYHQITGISVLDASGTEWMKPEIPELTRTAGFRMSSLPDTFSIQVQAAHHDEAVPTEAPLGRSEGTSPFTKALSGEFSSEGLVKQGARFRMAARASDPVIDHVPTVGETFSGRASIAFVGANINETGTFRGSFTSSTLSGLGYSGAVCIDHGKANPGNSSEPSSCVGSYSAKVSSVGDGTAYLNITITPDSYSSNYQRISVSMNVTAKPPTGKVRLHKYSGHPEFTVGNTAYDLTGAQYGIYTDRAATHRVSLVTVQGNDGWTDLSGELEEGTYYVKEVKAPKGYLINPHVMAITVDSGNNDKRIEMPGEMADGCIDDPLNALVQKAFTDQREGGKLQGDIATLAGIKFRVDYYANLYNSAEAAKASGAPKASAIFETNERGLLNFAKAVTVDNTTWPYKDKWLGIDNVIPLGTVVFTELNAPAGMVVRGYAQAFTITANADNTDTIRTPIGHWPDKDVPSGPIGAYENETWKGGVTVYKADTDGHTQSPQGDGDLTGITYEIVNHSQNPVVVNGQEIAVGAVAMTIQSMPVDGGYYATTGEKKLPYGTYTIRESSGNSSYHASDWSKDFTIRTDGQMVTYGNSSNWNEDRVKRGGIEITKADADTGASVPQGDASLLNTSYDIFNKSAKRVYVHGTWYAPNAKIMTVQTQWDAGRSAYVAKTGDKVLPFGTYQVVEAGAPMGYLKADYRQTVTVHDESTVRLKDAASKYNVDEVFRGGVSVTKADADTHTSAAQGDTTLEGVEYQIINRSAGAVFLRESMRSYNPGQVVMTIRTAWDGEKYVASTGAKTLPYGTYEIVESKVPDGYHNAGWRKTFTIRQDGEMHYYDRRDANDTATGYTFHHQWNENRVVRGGIVVGKVDNELKQYQSLGESHLDGTVFEVINKSRQAVIVKGESYAPNAKIMNLTISRMEHNGKTIYGATTGNDVLPYGTYEVREVRSSTGYLYNSTSKGYSQTVQIRSQGQMADLTDPSKAAANQVIREDWHFQKKAEDSMERLNKVAFLVTSMTTGERHVLVTDENGTWGSSWVDHDKKTNENDPTSPITNGALGVDAEGNWYVKDSSKLNFDSGIWFTGLPENQVQWASNGKSYTVGGKSIAVNKELRAFPYDTYEVQELRCDNNLGYKLVNFTVTLHRYTDDHDGPGLDIDYGTIDDKRIELGTTLVYGASDKVAPAGADVLLRDVVTFNNLDGGTRYTLKGELHLVNTDGSDGGVVARAEKEFNSGTGAGQAVVEFHLDTRELKGRSLVAFEYLMENGRRIAEHEDIADDNQTIKIPEIGTTLTGDLGHISNGTAKTITLTDKVTYKNLEIGKEYTAYGTLMDKATGEAVLDASGNPITAEKTFVPVSETGSVNVVFTFENVILAGKTVVAFESVNKDDVEYAVHADINDPDQTVQFPSVDTFAADGADANKDLAEAKNQSVQDAVKVQNLDKSYEYKLTGELHIRNEDGTDGGVLTDRVNGNPVSFQKEVTWKGNKSDQTLLFEGIDGTKLGGKDLVVFQTLHGRKEGGKWVLLGEHKDILDEDQSVRIPHIGTTLLTGQDLHESQVPEDGQITLKDRVSYQNLTPGHEYVMAGTLHVQDAAKDGTLSDGGAFQNNGKAVQAKASFIPTEADGDVELTFTFNAKGLEGKSVTAFETLYSSPVKDVPDAWKSFFTKPDIPFDKENPKKEWITAKHADIEDEGQTVHFAKIKTTLKDTNGLHESQVPTDEDKTVTLTDVVSYQNLIPGREYTMTGTLHVQATDASGHITDGGAVKDAAGNDVTSSQTFIPVTPNGKVEVIFTFDASGLEGKTVVAFESVSVEGKQFAVHTDITDESQSVHFVKLGTTALTKDGLHEIQVPKGEDKTITIMDTVRYENVIPGTEYTVSGTLHFQHVEEDGSISDGGAVKDKDGNEVIGTTTFTAKKPDGTVDVAFTFDADELNGMTLVAFETLFLDKTFVAHHEDIADEEQAIHLVEIETTALADNGLHESQVPTGEDKTVTITDRVDYTNLIPGTEYKVSGTLHIKEVDEDGNVADGGEVKDAVAEATFIPEAPDGFVDLEFTFDASDLEGQTVVAFEELSKNDIVIAIHTDIEDEDQSVHFATIHTTALAENELHMTQVPVGEDKMVTIIDTVAYENLIPGATYKVSGTLHLQDVDEEGHIVDGGAIRVPPLGILPDGVETPVPDEDAAEDIPLDDGGSDDDTVTEEIPTEDAPLEEPDKGPDGNPDENPDTPEEPDDGLVTLVAETVFMPEEANGTVDVVFTFDASQLAGRTTVAFEAISRDDKIVAVHEDIEDEEQSIYFVKIRTRALAENGEHEIMVPKEGSTTIKITDLVEYRNLIPDLEYTMTGEFHVQSVDEAGNITDGGVLKDKDGSPITSDVTFTPKEPDGSVEVEFLVDVAGLANQTIVAFETLTHEGITVAVHTDITDEYQSVTILPIPEEPPVADTPPEFVKTGQKPLYIILALIGIALMSGAGYAYIKKKR